jgi:Iron/manganese superoxide dismutases, alpha-hairpin domain
MEIPSCASNQQLRDAQQARRTASRPLSLGSATKVTRLGGGSSPDLVRGCPSTSSAGKPARICLVMYVTVVAAQAMDWVPPAMERAAMLVEWLRRNVAEFAAQLNKFLGTKARSLDPLWRSSGTRQRHSVLDIPIICAETEEQSVTELYTLPDLPYDPGALEPHISARITELHHDKHHAAYVKGANTARSSGSTNPERRATSQRSRCSKRTSRSTSRVTSCTRCFGPTSHRTVVASPAATSRTSSTRRSVGSPPSLFGLCLTSRGIQVWPPLVSPQPFDVTTPLVHQGASELETRGV